MDRGWWWMLVDEWRGMGVYRSADAAAWTRQGGPDDVMVSSTTQALLEGTNLSLEDMGTHELKGLPGARTVYRLVR